MCKQSTVTYTSKICFIFSNILTILWTLLKYYIWMLHASCEKECIGKPIAEHTWKIFMPMLVAWSALDFNGKTNGHGNKKHFYMQAIPSIVFQMFALFKILLKIRKMCAQTASLSIFPTDAFLLKLVGIDVQQAGVTGSICSNTFLQFLVHLDSIQTFLLFMMFVNVLWGIGADRMLLTGCYPLKLIGTANNTRRENETAAVSIAVAGTKFGSAFVARTSCFVHPEEQLRDCANKVSTDHHTAKIQQKVLWSNLFLCSSPFIAITLHSTFIHFRHWNFAIFVDLSDTFG